MIMTDIDSDGDATGFTFGEFSEIMRTQAAMDLDVDSLDAAFSHAIPAHGHPGIPLYQQAYAGRARARAPRRLRRDDRIGGQARARPWRRLAAL